MDAQAFEDRIKRLEAFAAAHPKLYKFQVLLLALGGYGYIALMLALLLGATGLTIYLWDIEVITRKIALEISGGILLVAWFVFRSLWIRVPPPEGIELTAEDSPELFRQLEAIRKASRGPKLHKVLLSEDFNAAIVQQPRWGMFGGARNYLLIGLPLLQTLTPEQFGAVLAHEYGHLSGKHGYFGAWIYRLRLTWARINQTLQQEESWGTFLFSVFFVRYFPFFDSYSFVLRRLQEYEADRNAAEVSSAEYAAQALSQVSVIGRFLGEHFWPKLYATIETRPTPPYLPLTAIPIAVKAGLTPERAREWLDEEMQCPTGVADTHPALSDRLGALQQAPVLPALPAQPASAHFFGARAKAYAKQLNQIWHDQVATDWREQHEIFRAERAELKTLHAQADAGGADADALWRRAQLAMENEDDDTAMAGLYRDVLAADPDHIEANFSMGAMLLNAEPPDAAGIELLERAMQQEPDYVMPGCRMIYAFWKHQGREAEAEAHLAKWNDTYEKLAEHEEGLELANYLKQDPQHVATFGHDRSESLQYVGTLLGAIGLAGLMVYLGFIRTPVDMEQFPYYVGILVLAVLWAIYMLLVFPPLGQMVEVTATHVRDYRLGKLRGEIPWQNVKSVRRRWIANRLSLGLHSGGAFHISPLLDKLDKLQSLVEIKLVEGPPPPSVADSQGDEKPREGASFSVTGLVLIVLLAAGGGAAYWYFFLGPGQHVLAGDPVGDISHSATPVADRGARPATVAGYFDRLHAAYRPRPDRRFMRALDEIHRFADAEPATVQAVFTENRWQLAREEVVLGTLAEYPDFAEFFAHLQTAAQQQAAPLSHQPLDDDFKADLDTQLAAFFTPHLAEAAASLNQAWQAGGRQSELLAYAVKAAVWMLIQHRDEMEVADALPRHALALTALYTGLSGQSLPREESLLAYVLGYSGHARQLAAELPADDPVRHYVMHDAAALAAYVKKHPRDRLAQYLNLKHIAREQDFPRWQAAFQGFKAASSPQALLPVLSTLARLNQFRLNRQVGEVLPYATVAVLAHDSAADGTVFEVGALLQLDLAQLRESLVRWLLKHAKTATYTAYFETRLAALTAHYQGPLLPAAVYADYFRGYFYSGLYRLGLFYFNSLSSPTAVADYLAQLGTSEDALFSDFQQWYRVLADVQAGRAQADTLLHSLSALPRLGVSPLLELLEEQENHYPSGQPPLLRGVKQLVPRLDTRPEALFYLARLAGDTLSDAFLKEKLVRHLLSAAPAYTEELGVWHAYFAGGETQLLALLEDPGLSAAQHQHALEWLVFTAALPPETLTGKIQTVTALHPDNFALAKYYMKWLEKNAQYDALRETAQAWLPRREAQADLSRIDLHVKIARGYLKQNRLDEALKTIHPWVSSYKANAMLVAAQIYEAQGKLTEAEDLFGKVYERYSHAKERRVDLVGFYWRQARYQEAAAMILEKPALTVSDWAELAGKSFGEVFADQESQARQALQALQDAGVSHWHLFNMLRAVGKSSPGLALPLLDGLRFNGPKQVQVLMTQYSYVQKLEGDTAAWTWLTTKVPGPMLHSPMMAMLAYSAGHYDILWRLEIKPAANHFYAYFQLQRAAAYLLAKTAQNDEHYAQIAAYFREHTDHPYHLMGRYLLGMIEAEALLARIDNPRVECEAAYFLGVRAQSEGRYAEASAWYRISMETGVMRAGEYQWAYWQLNKWRIKGTLPF